MLAGTLFMAVSAFASQQTPLPIRPDVISFFGSDKGERIQGIHFHEGLNQVFAAGNTASRLELKFPSAPILPGRDQVYDGGSGDGFVARFSKNLKNLEAWTYLGGALNGTSSTPGDDRVYTVDTDSSDNVYAYGFSATAKFFTDGNAIGGAIQGRRDVFLAKLSNDLSTLHWVLRLGGNDVEATSGSAELEQGRNTLLVMDDGTCYVSGGTNNPDFFDDHAGITPVVQHVARQQQGQVVNPGNFDAFLAKVDPDGTLAWATFFGGDGDESAYSGIAGRSGSIFVAGNVNDEDTNGGQANTGNFWSLNSHPGTGLPGTGCPGPAACKFQREYQGGSHALGAGGGFHHIVGGDGFIAKFDANTGALKWTTYLGGSDFDEISDNDAFAIGATGLLHVVGSTTSTDFPMPTTGTSFDTTLNSSGDRDGFVAILNSGATELLHSTYLGGEGFEELSGLALDSYGYVYVSGNTNSGATASNGSSTASYPTTSDAFQCQNYQTYPVGGSVPVTAMLAKLSSTLNGLEHSTYLGGSQLGGTQSGPSTIERVRSVFWITGDWCYVGGCTNSGDLASIHSNPPPNTCPAGSPIPTGNPPLHQLGALNLGLEEDAFLARIKMSTFVQQ